ncbi:MAG: NAD-dependent epimerase/dehydratase [Bacteroidetes bacterium OLB9]|nr:MAG: NAD-dependent epimerase/dehydratase [Bacteroidetes bacterium OLB9]MCZ2338803.1 NAD(P)-dependent oxidoreductase [Chitinophagales bacterium]
MKTKILLTGASGNIGYELLKQLIAQKERFDITVFDLKTSRSTQLFEPFGSDIRVIYGDITLPEATIEAAAQKDVIIHLAALIPPAADEKPELAHRINVGGTGNLIRNVEQYSPDAFFVYSSSVAVYGDRLDAIHIKVGDELNPSKGDHYAVSKIQAEEQVRKSALRWSIFRLSAIMGIGNHKLTGLMFEMPLNTPMEITTPEDTARAFLHSIDHQESLTGMIFNLGGGEKCRILYKDLLARSFKIYGLGRFSFPAEAFAAGDFHCGYYADGDQLEAILHFRRDNIETYFEKVSAGISPMQVFFTRPFACIAKQILLTKSRPYKEHKNKIKGVKSLPSAA